MGRKVSNQYGVLPNAAHMTMEIVSSGYYALEIVFDADNYDLLSKYSWCYEASKGLVYTMDLTMELPKLLGYITPRVYLRDLILHKNGKLHKAVWNRPTLEDYRYDTNHVKLIRGLPSKTK